MLDFSAPSFSLGLDLDIADLPTDAEPEEDDHEEREDEDGIPKFELLRDHESGPQVVEEGEEELVPGGDSDPQPIQDPPLPPLKRLRRGPPPLRPPARRSVPSPAAACSPPSADGDGIETKDTPMSAFVIVDDDIEEFSSQEEQPNRDWFSSVQSRLTSSTSKFSLLNHGSLTSESTNKRKAPKVSPASNASTSATLENSSNMIVFPKLTISPLRKIHLLDSDSDDLLSNNDVRCGNKVDALKRTPKTTNNQKKSFKSKRPQEDSFWKDFSPKKNISMATPALDDFCEDYFRTVKDPEVGKSKEEGTSFCSSRVLDADEFANEFEGHSQKKIPTMKPKHCGDLSNLQPPAYQYFYHDDAKIRTLVNERLRYFAPLSAEPYTEQKLPMEDNLNYMNQFGPENGRSQARKKSKLGTGGSSKKGKKLDASGSWVSPKNSAAIPKNAGKRRVRADGHQSGHWFTGQDGRKVYVTKNGQELTGQTAYRQYRKESGTGYRRSKKKVAAKRKKK